MSKVSFDGEAESSADVIVLGAGPAGLGAAYKAAAAGRKVMVFERADGVGGLAASFEVSGIRVDHGSHRLHQATPPHILDELKSLMGADLQERRRNGRIYLEGRWIKFPLQFGNLIKNLPPSFALAAGRDAVMAWSRSPASETFAGVLEASLGPTMSERFYFPYARKLWGLEPEAIHPEQARRRVSGNAASKLLRRVAARSETAGLFYYPRRGFGQIWEALAGGFLEKGGDLRLGSAVRSVESHSKGLRVLLGSGEAVSAPQVWSTVPMPLLAQMADPPPPAGVLEAAGKLRTRAMLLVYLVLNTDRFTGYDAHYLPGPSTPVTRISEPKNYRRAAEPPDRTVLCAELPCFVGEPIWGETEDALGEIVLDTLRRMQLPSPRPEFVHVKRVPSAYPVYDLDYEESFTTLAEWVDSIPGLLSFGRHGGFVHNNSHHALEMGWAAAEALGSSGDFDSSAWAASLQGFADHVVED
ncbi:MAG: FAD-dependent oxidoreductase [Actinomycetota bacterium]